VDIEKSNFIKSKKQEIINYYQSGYSANKISKILKIGDSTIGKYLREWGIQIKSRGEVTRKYCIDETYFDKINTEEKAYFLGLLYADGNNRTKNHAVEISLIEEDKYILDKFAQELKTEKPLYFKKLNDKNKNWNNVFRLAFNSVKLSNRLNDLGVIPRKSLVLTFPSEDDVRSNLLKHFIRGYFDGDGCVSYYTKNDKYKDKITQYKYGNFSMVGTFDVLSHIKLILDEELDIKLSLDKIKNIYKLGTADHTAIRKIFCYFYNNSNIFLIRKYNKFIDCLRL
jgi:intein-encoded DNA endonuclease-like protein